MISHVCLLNETWSSKFLPSTRILTGTFSSANAAISVEPGCPG